MLTLLAAVSSKPGILLVSKALRNDHRAALRAPDRRRQEQVVESSRKITRWTASTRGDLRGLHDICVRGSEMKSGGHTPIYGHEYT